MAVSERLENPDIDPATQQTGYASEQELLADLALIHESLVSNGDANLTESKLKRRKQSNKLKSMATAQAYSLLQQSQKVVILAQIV